MQYYKLDPENYISASSLAWDAMLYKTGIELELVSDCKVFSMIQEQTWGGLSLVGKKDMTRQIIDILEMTMMRLNQPASFHIGI